MNANPYRKLLIMTALHFLSMYILMYAMVNTIGNVFHNLNQFYMAALMSAPMLAISLALMGGMYPNKRLNMALIAAGILALVIFFLFIRQQTAIADKQFLRSMIPHHAGAILMCERAPIQDPEIRDLCRSIIASQQAEIDQMKTRLNELEQ